MRSVTYLTIIKYLIPELLLAERPSLANFEKDRDLFSKMVINSISLILE